MNGLRVTHGVVGGSIPRTIISSRVDSRVDFVSSVEDRVEFKDEVEGRQDKSLKGEEGGKERTPRSKMKRLIEVQEQGWSPSSKTLTR